MRRRKAEAAAKAKVSGKRHIGGHQTASERQKILVSKGAAGNRISNALDTFDSVCSMEPITSHLAPRSLSEARSKSLLAH